jgi:hypothetical protein
MVKDSNNPLPTSEVGPSIAPRAGLTEFTTRGVSSLPFRRGVGLLRDWARTGLRGPQRP